MITHIYIVVNVLSLINLLMNANPVTLETMFGSALIHVTGVKMGQLWYFGSGIQMWFLRCCCWRNQKLSKNYHEDWCYRCRTSSSRLYNKYLVIHGTSVLTHILLTYKVVPIYGIVATSDHIPMTRLGLPIDLVEGDLITL